MLLFPPGLEIELHQTLVLPACKVRQIKLPFHGWRLRGVRCEVETGILHYHSWQTQTINIWLWCLQDSLYLLWRPAGGQLPTTGGGPGRPHLPHRDHPLLHHEGEAVCPLQQELLLGGERRGDNISWTRDSHTTILRLLGRVPSLLLSFHDMLALLWSPLLHGFQQPTFDIELVNHQNRQSDTEIIWCSQW